MSPPTDDDRSPLPGDGHGGAKARHPRVVDYPLTGGKALLLHLDSGEYHELNAVGTVIWELLDGERSVAQVVEALSERVEDPPPDLDHFVRRFLDELLQRELLA